MRKAFTVSAIAVAASLAVAVPATAFAADGSPAPSPVVSTSTGTQTDQQQEAVQVRLSQSSGKPGDKVTVTVKTSGKADKVSVSSDGLQDIQVAQASKTGDTWIATATIAKNAKFGTYQVNAIANFPDTAQQASATLSVNTDPIVKPDPAKASMSLSTDGGKPGDKVDVTIKGATGSTGTNASVESDAFGGKVALQKSGENTWHGTATVSKNTKSGYYRVDGYVGKTRIDSAKFGVANDVAHHTDHNKVAPLNPTHHKTPRGSVNTGQAPAASSHDGINTGMIAGASALGIAALAGSVALRRRRTNG
ncbi:hypothetical protein [Streptomyces beijiangensis]|uniref:Gram-positive cocci surface proteins LPxTG domain-containing protein n=1 Tax=Streptomyces beijiangensis TaxID=163361 RepID=A0A939FH86_9ACTN|nr:hypothetical protein [Streptomyces beijiangensis]MBO0517080.1 hypothetical protein [Streptomyces beijiangensis]